MFYREAGQFKTTYVSDQAMFPIPQDRFFVIGLFLLSMGSAVRAEPLVEDQFIGYPNDALISTSPAGNATGLT